MLDHIGFSVSDPARSRAFYVKALAPLGYMPVMDLTREQTGSYEGTGFGANGRPYLWIGAGEPSSGPMHVALVAASRADVDRFHAAAIAAGGRDNGPPGLRPHYHLDYYGAFVFDPDGNNVEAVCHAPES
ncbi:MAG TPA: VOC family protein [Rhodanobacteraceae bacterium]|jgi:catechol 2,3-dioxygenase-like lactoylglutathione lyase family enzyme|nr:VOC family protein [Rhodanobacteraceae bacterium]